MKRVKGIMFNPKTTGVHILSMCMLLLAAPAFAETDGNGPDAGETVQLGRSVVSPDYIEIEKLKSTKKVIVLDKDEIQGKGYTSISKVLDDLPGITAGTSGWGEIDIRGQGQGEARKNIQFLIDGVPITTMFDHPYKANYDIIPVDQIEKIEIIPGGGSVLYGEGTSGGVINVTTNLRAMTKPVNKIGVMYSPEHEKKFNVNGGFKIGEDLVVQANYSKGDRDWFFVDTYSNTDYFSGGLNYKLTDSQRLAFKYSRFTEDGQFIQTLKADDHWNDHDLATYGRDYRPDPLTITIGLDANGQKIYKDVSGYRISDRIEEHYNGIYSANFTDKTRLMVNAFYTKGNFKNNTSEGDDEKVVYQDSAGAKAKLDINYGNQNSILFGVDYSHRNANLSYNDYLAKKTKYGYAPDTAAGESVDKYGNILNADGEKIYFKDPLIFDYTKDNLSFYFLNIFKFSEFELTTGVRYDQTTWDLYKKSAGGWGTLDDTDDRINMNYELSLGWNYSDSGKLYGRYERAFAAPSALQMTDRIRVDGQKKTIITPAEDQTFDIYEIGMRDYLMGSAVNLTLFYNETDNQFKRYYDFRNGWETKTRNVIEGYRLGAELTAQQEIGRWSLEESYTFLYGRRHYRDDARQYMEDDDITSFADGGLKKVPRHSVLLKADYQATDDLTFGAAWKYQGEYNNVLEQEDKTGTASDLVSSRILTDISFRYSHPSGFDIYGGVNNLFDIDYFEYQEGDTLTVTPGVGRAFYVGMDYTF